MPTAKDAGYRRYLSEASLKLDVPHDDFPDALRSAVADGWELVDAKSRTQGPSQAVLVAATFRKRKEGVDVSAAA